MKPSDLHLATCTIVSDSIRFIINFLKKFPKLGKYLSHCMPLLECESAYWQHSYWWWIGWKSNCKEFLDSSSRGQTSSAARYNLLQFLFWVRVLTLKGKSTDVMQSFFQIIPVHPYKLHSSFIFFSNKRKKKILLALLHCLHYCTVCTIALSPKLRKCKSA